LNIKQLPIELSIFYPLLDEEEKELINERSELMPYSSLEETLDLLVSVYSSSSKHSPYFMFLLGRILHHLFDLEKLEYYYNMDLSPELGLWYSYSLFLSGENEKSFNLLSDLRKAQIKPIFSIMFCVIKIHHLILTSSQENYRYFKEECLNNILVEDADSVNAHRELYKLLVSYVLILEIYFQYINNDIKFAKEYMPIPVNLVKIVEDRINQAYLYRLSALIEFKSNNFTSAHQFLLKAEAIAETLYERRLIVSINAEIGDVYLQMGHLDDAFLYYEESVKKIERWFPRNKTLKALLLSKFSDYYFIKEEYEQAIQNLREAISLQEESGFRPITLQLKYAEYLLNLEKIKEADAVLTEALSDCKTISPTNEAYKMYLRGFIELKKNNFGIAQEFLYKAITLSDNLGHEWTSSKSLVLLLILLLKKYDLAMNVEDILEADKCMEDIITFLEEKAKYKELAQIYLIRAKIKITLLDFDTALLLLKAGEQYARQYYPSLINRYNKQIDTIKESIEFRKSAELISKQINFREEIEIIFNILLKQTKKLGAPIESITIAVLIFHSSGIPVSTYRSAELHISDDMIFGGFVSAIRHLLDELFLYEESKALSVDHGQYKLLIEFYRNLFSIVVVTLRDSFLLRRKMHQLVNYIASKELFKEKYYGELDELVLRDIDSYVERLFNVKRD